MIFQIEIMHSRIYLFVLLFLASFQSFAQLGGPGLGGGSKFKDPAHWSYQLSNANPSKGETIEIIFTALIDDGWYMYSNNFDPNLGPNLTEVNFTLSGATLKGSAKPKGEESKYEEIWGGTVKIFKHKAEFRQKIKIDSENPQIKGTIIYQCCSLADGVCLPPKEWEFVVEGIKVSASGTTQKVTKGECDELMTELNTRIDLLTKKDSINTLLIQSLQEEIRKLKGGDTTSTSAATIQCPDDNNTAESESLFSFIIFAFIAGILALLTPCVFPMIPMTVTFFTRAGETDKHARKMALVYGISIIVIYGIIGIPIAILNGPEFANFLSTHWLPNIIFTAIFLIFGISFLGFFDITLPNALVNKIDQHSEKGGLIGIFFMAFTIVLVSFSCTGPVVGTILVHASGEDKLKPIIGMISFATAFAIPFTFFALFPNMMNKIPKSGSWLNTVKVTLGFLELALALKFVSMADLAYHWNILSRELFLILWIVISLAYVAYLLRWLPLPGSAKEKINSIKIILMVLVLALAGYLTTGLFGSPLKNLSGYLPPKRYADADYKKLATDFQAGKISPVCDVPLYSDRLHLPHGLAGYFDFEQALECAKQQKKPLFIDFTGHGCVNCRKMEQSVWADQRVLDILQNDYIIVELYVDDKTELPKGKQYVSSRDKKLKTTIGAANADLEITRFDNIAQPYYVLLDPFTEKVLVTPTAYDHEEKPENFIDFLNRGKNCFKEHSR